MHINASQQWPPGHFCVYDIPHFSEWFSLKNGWYVKRAEFPKYATSGANILVNSPALPLQ